MSEKFFIAVIVIAIFLFNLAPYIYQYRNLPTDKTYVGSYPIVIDKPVYLAEMTQGAKGEWLFTYNYTTELTKKTFIYFFYIFLGHVAVFLKLSLEATFFLSRFFFGSLLIITVVFFIRYFVKNTKQRKIALLCAFFSSGLGFLTYNPISFDLWIPDFMPMVRFSNFPHMVLADILLLAIMLLFFHSLKIKSIKLALLAGFLSFILNILLPYHNFIIYTVIILFLLFNFIKNRSIFFSDYLKNGLVFFLISLPSFLYMSYLGIADPFWREVAKYNSLPTPSLSVVLSGYGLVLIFSFLGLYSMHKNKNVNFLLFFLWIFSALFLAFMPFIPMQRRILETGLFVPLAITASFGAADLYNRLKARKPTLAYIKATLILVFVLPFMLFGNVMNWVVYTEYIHKTNDPRFYVPNENIEAMRWLRQNSFSDSIILSSYYNGNIIPYYADRRVYIGHAFMTIDFKDKIQKAEDFYLGRYSMEESKDFLKREKIDYVFFSKDEKNIKDSKFTPENYSFLEKYYQKNNVTIYKVLLSKT